jgi:hypothetical protein
VQVDAARMGARSVASISSWSFKEGRLERLQATVTCGSWRWHQFTAGTEQLTVSEGVPKQDRKRRYRERAGRLQNSPLRRGFASGSSLLRQEILGQPVGGFAITRRGVRGESKGVK